jgi:molecular chaperone DnaJ
MAQAALGTEVEVETLDEPRAVTVPAGTQAGTVVRLRGLGVPHLRGRGRGDLYVHLAVDTPVNLTARQRELLVALAAERGEEVHGHDGVLSRIRSALG